MKVVENQVNFSSFYWNIFDWGYDIFACAGSKIVTENCEKADCDEKGSILNILVQFYMDCHRIQWKLSIWNVSIKFQVVRNTLLMEISKILVTFSWPHKHGKANYILIFFIKNTYKPWDSRKSWINMTFERLLE